jgi:serine/threonine-protein kinase
VRRGADRFDVHLPEGTVLAQNPPAGSKVRERRRIYLTVSVGEFPIEVPNVRGTSYRAAKMLLEKRGLKLANVRYEPSNDFPEETVIEQDVPAGTKIKRGSSISIVLSQGRGSGRVLVPNIVGKSLSDAEKILTQNHLSVGKITYQVSSDLLPNTVVEQYPPGGDLVNEGQAIDLFVVKAGAEVLEGPPENKEKKP